MQSCLKLIKAVENVRNVEIRVAVFAKSTRILALSRIKTGTSIPLDGGRGGEMCWSRVTCKSWKIQYVGSTDPSFRVRVNNYEACYRKHISGKLVPQASFHTHFAQEDHNGMDDWEFTLIDRSTNLPSVRRREFYWQYELNTFHPDDLNIEWASVPIDDG